MTTTQQQNETTQLIRQILGDGYTHLVVGRVNIEENLERKETRVQCEVTDEQTGEQSTISGRGVGVVDAFFKAMVERFAAEYPSLKTIRFHSFSVRAQLETRQNEAGTDAKGEVTLEITNSEGSLFCFSHVSRSVVRSVIITTLLGLEYFINSERAFIATYHALKDARERNRPDLVQRYTDSMTMLVKNTSYSEVISKIRQEMGREREQPGR